MPSLIDLRRRIKAVKNTQQITKAMKMVAASKLRRAQERMSNARPYAQQMQRVLSSLASRVDPSIHPLLADRELRPDSTTLVIVVTADKGLCGSFNTNIIKAVEWANRKGLTTVGLTGFGGGKLKTLAHHNVYVAIDDMGIVESLHQVVFHWVIDDMYRRISGPVPALAQV